MSATFKAHIIADPRFHTFQRWATSPIHLLPVSILLVLFLFNRESGMTYILLALGLILLRLFIIMRARSLRGSGIIEGNDTGLHLRLPGKEAVHYASDDLTDLEGPGKEDNPYWDPRSGLALLTGPRSQALMLRFSAGGEHREFDLFFDNMYAWETFQEWLGNVRGTRPATGEASADPAS